MGFFHRQNIFTILLFILSIFLASLQLGEMRPLGQQWPKQNVLVFQSFQKGPVTPSGPNPCSYIPGRGKGHCTLNDMNIAGNVARAPPAFPNLVVDVAVASIDNETRDNHQSS